MSQTSHTTMKAVLNRIELAPRERHELLASDRRRQTVEALADATAAVELGDLAAEISARETTTDEDERSKERVAISLHHVHLPKMVDAGILEYDPTERVIEPLDAPVNPVPESE